jgi:hypothetical protein
MVLLKTTIAGTVLLALGVLLLFFGGQYVTIEIQQVNRHNVEPHAEFLVGDIVDRTYSLPAGVNVLGTVSATEAPSNQTGDIRFSVLDADNYQRRVAGLQPTYLYDAQKQGHFNFTFTTGQSGVYHFIFDNSASVYKKYVILTMAYDEITTSQAPDTRATYVAWGLVIASGLILIYGLVRKAPVTWA